MLARVARLALSFAALVIVPWAICATVQEAQKSTRVTLSPQLGIAPLTVQIRAFIDHPSEDWYCPSMEIIWTDDTKSFRESDCPPWPEVEEGYRWAPDPVWKRLGVGKHKILVTLKQGKQERPFVLDVEVLG